MTKALENATTKGHSVMYREKILPALTLNKNTRHNNSAAVNIVSEKAKKEFIEKWKETKVDIAADNDRRSKIKAIVEPLIGTEPTKVVMEIPEVRTAIGDARVCWGCLSSTCLIRQNISAKVTGKKFVNRHCMTRRTVLGDRNLMTSLQAQVGKDNQVAAFEKKKGDKRRFKGKLNHFSAAVIKKSDTSKQIVPEEKIKRVNLTGIPDEELYGPYFLYEETEFYTEKKTISTNSAGIKQEPSYTSKSDDKFDMFDEVQCTYCGIEEQHHIDTMHHDEDEEIGAYKAPEQEASDCNVFFFFNNLIRIHYGLTHSYLTQMMLEIEYIFYFQHLNS